MCCGGSPQQVGALGGSGAAIYGCNLVICVVFRQATEIKFLQSVRPIKFGIIGPCAGCLSLTCRIFSGGCLCQTGGFFTPPNIIGGTVGDDCAFICHRDILEVGLETNNGSAFGILRHPIRELSCHIHLRLFERGGNLVVYARLGGFGVSRNAPCIQDSLREVNFIIVIIHRIDPYKRSLFLPILCSQFRRHEDALEGGGLAVIAYFPLVHLYHVHCFGMTGTGHSGSGGSKCAGGVHIVQLHLCIIEDASAAIKTIGSLQDDGRLTHGMSIRYGETATSIISCTAAMQVRNHFLALRP